MADDIDFLSSKKPEENKKGKKTQDKKARDLRMHVPDDLPDEKKPKVLNTKKQGFFDKLSSRFAKKNTKTLLPLNN